MAIEKKDIMGVAPWIFDFFGGPGNKLKKKQLLRTVYSMKKMILAGRLERCAQGSR